MATLGIRLSDVTLERWRTHCEGLGVKPGTAVRQSIERAVEAPPTDFKQTRKAKYKTVRVPVWLSETEIDSIRVRQRLEGGSRAGWIVRVVRSALTREPQFGDHEIEALTQSNFQLLAIGRNLNQIARRLNEGQKRQDVELDAIVALRDQINEHTRVVSRAMRASTERWTIE